ncbi:MAG: energy transducer TonB [Bacteroidota bacterium]
MSVFHSFVLAALLIPSVLLAQVPKVHDYVYVDQEPVILNLNDVRKAIGYPFSAIKQGIEGKVYCRVLVNENGVYIKHRILNSAHPILTKAVNPYLNQLKFIPAKRGKESVSYWTNIPFAFSQEECRLYLRKQSENLNFGVSYAKKAAMRIENAKAYLANKEFEASALEYTRALMYIPIARKRPAKAAAKLFDIYMGRAQAYMGAQQYEKAVADLIQAIGLGHTAYDKAAISQTQIANAYNLRSYCRLAMGQTSQAAKDISWVLFNYQRLESAVYRAQAHQIAVHRQLSQFEKALALAEETIERSPEEPYAYYQKGLVLWTIGAEEAAMNCFIQAQSRNLSKRDRAQIERLIHIEQSVVLEP